MPEPEVSITDAALVFVTAVARTANKVAATYPASVLVRKFEENGFVLGNLVRSALCLTDEQEAMTRLTKALAMAAELKFALEAMSAASMLAMGDYASVRTETNHFTEAIQRELTQRRQKKPVHRPTRIFGTKTTLGGAR